MSNNEKRVEILNGTPGKKGIYLSQLYDPDSGKYFAPMLPEHPAFESIKNAHERGLTSAGVNVAIIDTGLMLNHPWIKRSMGDSVDFTGEGMEDLNGHGTMVALIVLMDAPDAKVFNVKVMDSEGRGSEEKLIKGIQWAVKKGVHVINLSVGVYHKKWGLLDCNGDCKICRAAENAAKAGVIVVAAAGNESGKTYCPAKVGIVKKDIGVISVAAYDFETGKMESYSGVGSIAAPVGRYRFVSVE